MKPLRVFSFKFVSVFTDSVSFSSSRWESHRRRRVWWIRRRCSVWRGQPAVVISEEDSQPFSCKRGQPRAHQIPPCLRYNQSHLQSLYVGARWISQEDDLLYSVSPIRQRRNLKTEIINLFPSFHQSYRDELKHLCFQFKDVLNAQSITSNLQNFRSQQLAVSSLLIGSSAVWIIITSSF